MREDPSTVHSMMSGTIVDSYQDRRLILYLSYVADFICQPSGLLQKF